MKKKLTVLLVIFSLAAAFLFAGCGEKPGASQPQVSITAASSEEAPESSAETSATSETASARDGSEEIPSDSQSVLSSAESSAEETEPETDVQTASSQSEAASSAPSSEESSDISSEVSGPEAAEEALTVTEDGEYTDKDHVALYIHEFGHLPSNYVSKYDAMDAGWDSKAGNLNKVLPGMSIGGDKFGNYEGLLPKANGRKYYECDIDFNPEGETSRPVYRNEKRIIFSNDGLVFYTEDHYNSFEQLY